jgi:formylglycine-generating enzyme required for sulfatase activity
MALSTEISRARAQTDSLFAAIDPAALYDRPLAERHRLIFYLGHLEAFDWNQLRQSGISARSPVPVFDDLFAFGIDPEPGHLPSDKVTDWPSIKEVERYNAGVRQIVDENLAHLPSDIANMMIEHRHMHAETFTYILHGLPSAKKSGPAPMPDDGEPVTPAMIRIPAGYAELGRNSGDGFGWDNEFDRHSVFVPEFSIGQYKVTNGDYLKFVNQGGPVPHYWSVRDGRWFWRGVFGDVPLPLSWPVYATLDQARAYARSLGAGIPTEAQWHRAAPNTVDPDANLDYLRWDPVPVSPAQGIAQMVGNGWEWTDSVFAPFDGFAPRPTYPGYSANFFDGNHFVLKGASPRTAARLVRRSLRNWFRPEYPYVYATFRLCQP